ncbi:peptidylprolyl isomerase [Kerstersia gyiorum]|jgi:peptidyl-prolyl cis-trans isomerase C|uniref:peptidylprolyl isomerase n=1 Tax=Kerstersia gyiorum TaxID=206506 RepID=A0A171KVX0_9BURK|nr:peptidylprolyl isomerase [Kerstersia gyiorum]AZV94695.1 peptidylprolyl isomerase [Bordetella sp. J329]MCO7635546.1 peptidylprolyl isomerase [Pseudomonas sp. S 311-6]KAB0541897.1 peptidylprolyl isomerase [Kerstersia gyiorum]KKO73037.1 peptidylprolyl isomerase [Kerstersia gyiorum]MCH4271648.1 peptidylprolyl isomerase [Kerstersia gyiorum]
MKRFAVLLAAAAISAPIYAQNIATVNGKPISQKDFDQFISLLVDQGATDSPQLREQVKQELINRQVLVQAAESAKVGSKPEIVTEIELARQGILVRGLMDDYLEKNPVSDSAIQAEYDKVKAEQGNQQEYKVRHILVEDEKTAQDVQKQLKDKKSSFADLAKKYSRDPGSAQRGGDLGWGAATNYVKPFADAVTALQKGQMSAAPVKSDFGWHIIELEDVRPVAFPPLEQVRPQIEQMLRQQALSKYQQDLVEKAKIQEN